MALAAFDKDQAFARARRWLALWTRILSGFVGGYALAVAAVFALSRGLPASRAEAMTAAELISILVMPAGVVWAFAARTAFQAFAGIAGATALLALAAWLLGQPA